MRDLKDKLDKQQIITTNTSTAVRDLKDKLFIYWNTYINVGFGSRDEMNIFFRKQ